MSSSHDSVPTYTSLECVALAFCTPWHFEEREDPLPCEDAGQPAPGGHARVAAAPGSEHPRPTASRKPRIFRALRCPWRSPLSSVPHTAIKQSFNHINGFADDKSDARLF